MFSDEQTTYGVYCATSKEVFRFGDDYKKALFAYFDIIRSEMNGHTFPEDWYLVLMQGNRIVQLEHIELKKQIKIVEFDDSFNVHN